MSRKFSTIGTHFLLSIFSVIFSCTVFGQSPFDEKTEKSQNPVRTWKDATGKFEVKAKLLNRTIDGVKLEKEDGRIIEVPLAKLSVEDKKYLESIRKKPVDANPFAGGKMKSTKSESTKPSTTPDPKTGSVALNTVTPTLTAAKTLTIPDAKNWSMTPDPESAADAVHGKSFDRPASGLAHAVHDRLKGFKISENEKWAALALGNAFGNEKTIIQIYDLVKGEVAAKLTIPQKDAVLAGVTTESRVFATTRKKWFKTAGRIDFWDATADLKHVVGWEGDYISAMFLNDELLVTIDNKKKGMIWDWKNRKAVVNLPGNTSGISKSQNGKYLAIANDKGISFLDLNQMKINSQLADASNVSQMAFSKDGSKLAGTSGSTLSIWDLTNGKRIDRYTVNGISMFNARIHWVDNEHILVNERYMVNYKLRVPVWDFQGSPAVPLTPSKGDRYWFAMGNRDGSAKMIPTKLPLAEIQDLSSKYVPEDFLVIKPGISVAIRLNLPFGQPVQQNIYDKLEAKLKENGVKIDPSASMVLSCYTEKGKPVTREYRDIGVGRFGARGSQKVTFTPTISYMQLTEGEKVIWKRVVSSGPGFTIMLKKGQTAQQAATERSKANPNHFLGATIPKQFAKLPQGKTSLGSSKFSESGIQ